MTTYKTKIITSQQCYDIGEEHIRVDIGVILYIKVLWWILVKNAIHKSTLVDIGVILYIKVLWWILGLLGVISCRACSRERLPDGHIGNAATLKIFCFLFFYFANIAEAAVQHFEFHLHADNFSQCQG